MSDQPSMRVPCEHCKELVHRKAKVCPHCRKKNPTGRVNPFSFSSIAAVFVLAFIAMWVSTKLGANDAAAGTVFVVALIGFGALFVAAALGQFVEDRQAAKADQEEAEV